MKKIFLLSILNLFSMTFVYAYDFAAANSEGVIIYYNWGGTKATVTYRNTSYNCYWGSVAIPNEVVYNGTTYVVTAIETYAFRNCNELTSVTIPNSVTSIGNYAFSGCSELTSVIIPSSVTSIGGYAFSGCSSLKNIVLEDGTTALSFGTTSESERVFENCPVESLYLGRSISYYSPFKYKSTLTSITIGNLVTSIGDYAFFSCGGLTSISIPNSVTEIGYYSFAYCSKLKNVVFEDGTTILSFPNLKYENPPIGFANSPLENLYIGRNISYYISSPGSILFLAHSPFKYNTTLKLITLGNLVTSIEKEAFFNCTNLMKINSKNPIPPQTSSDTFYGIDKKVCALYIPVGSTIPYLVHPVWRDFTNIQEKDFEVASINNIVSDAEISAHVTNNGIKITGCNPLDKANIYTVNGELVYSSVIDNGFIYYPLQKGIYIIHTSKKSLKVIY